MRKTLRKTLGALLAATVIVVPGTSASAAPSCSDPSAQLTVEEQRLAKAIGADPEPVAARLIRSGGLNHIVHAFQRSLCHAPSTHVAATLARAHGRHLWEAAVAARGDDRPLYWARLSMTGTIRQWRAPATVDKAAVERELEHASRGITSSEFAPMPGVRRLFVSGFDPFQLDSEIRRANPSGAGVLALDGRVITVGGQLVQIQAAIFPVRYADFDAGMVERAFTPHLAAGAQLADIVATVSQGRPGQFDLEVHNGRRRSVSSIGDNNNIWGGGSAVAPRVFPGVGPGAEFVPSSLPVQAMSTAQGAFPVKINSSVYEIPAGQSAPVFRPDGPTAGSVAVQGGGGGYLSNEIAYRASLLREALGAPVRGGHVHTPVLNFGPGNTTDLTDPVFEAGRASIVTELEAILRAAV
ncbi:hypothetical protein [Longispora albida]|uniref:hypothetical protein n=1 Tax=Longispora albida TaxID=203523 RepID=UPI0003654C86|nr:hypothetical protein [Longispora albida]